MAHLDPSLLDLDPARVLQAHAQATSTDAPLFQATEELPSLGREQIGTSRQGRPMFAWRFASSAEVREPLRVSLIAGCHADEPVGPAMLERLVQYLAALPIDAPLRRMVSWSLVPHANPDGDAVNANWRESLISTPAASTETRAGRGYDLAAYLDGTVRELPGDDIEFGFPVSPEVTGTRPENQAIASFLRRVVAEEGPFDLHTSFHGMAFAAGPWFLLEATWANIRVVDEPGPDRTVGLRRNLARDVADLGYQLHDVDRGGEKGFCRIEEGFCTRPDSRAMRDHFLARSEPEVAARFRPSSMEFVRSLGTRESHDPLTLVSEMPLFLLPREPYESMPDPTGTEGMARFRLWLEEQRRQSRDDAAFVETMASYGVAPMALEDQMWLQLAFLREGLRAAAHEKAGAARLGQR